jgi:hypothetical protein
MDSINDIIRVKTKCAINDKFNSSTGNLQLLYLNVNSLRSDEKRETLDLFLTSYIPHIKILVLVETFFTHEKTAWRINNYIAHHSIRERHGGGVSIYTHNSLNASKISNVIKDENEFVVVHLPHHNLNIVGMYRPPHTNIPVFINTLDNLLNNMSRCVAIGDCNINRFCENDSNVLSFNSMIESNGHAHLIPCEKNYFTRQGLSVPTLIDHCFTNITNANLYLNLLDCAVSDHRGIQVNFNSCPVRQQSTTYENVFINYRGIMSEVMRMNRDVMNFDSWYKKICSIIRENRVVSCSIKNNKARKAFIGKTLLELQKKRDRWYKLWKLFPLNEFYENKFKTIKKELAYKVLESKKKYYNKMTNEAAKNPKKLWGIFKEIVGNTPEKSQTIYKIMHDNSFSERNIDVANAFNKYFVTIGKCLASKIPPTCEVPVLNSKVISRNAGLNIIRLTDINEISQVIDSFDNCTAAGKDNISVKLLKMMKPVIVDKITEHVNFHFENGIYPESLKISRVSVIYKTGNKCDPGNYRDITLSSVFAKIFDQLIKVRLEEYLCDNNLISCYQYGFLKGSSTSLAALNLLKQVYNELNKGLKCSAIFVDIKKAFNTVNHDRLKLKMQQLGIGGNFMKIILSYLHNRRQVVRINGCDSDEQNINIGTPQGSALSALLFLIYVNDLQNIKLISAPFMFADDLALITSADSVEALRTNATHDLDQLFKWLCLNELSMNVEKTKLLDFKLKHSNEITTRNSIKFMAGEIEQVSSYEYLGLVLNSSLNFNDHILKVMNKIAPYIHILGRSKYLLSSSNLKKIYYAHVHCHLTYMIVAYASAPQTYINRLFVMQKKAIKHIYKLRWDHPTNTLFRDNILPLNKIIQKDYCLTTYKILNGHLNRGFTILRRSNVSSRHTRQSNDLEVMCSKLAIVNDSFFVKGIKCFNDLPVHIKNISSLSTFIRELKAHLT